MTEALYTQNTYHNVYGCYRQKMQEMFPRMGAEIRPGTAYLPEMQIPLLEPGTEGQESMIKGSKMSEESLKKLSEAVKEKWRNPEYRKSCHAKTNHNREHWEQYFADMINSDYGGKCYLTKEEMKEVRRLQKW